MQNASVEGKKQDEKIIIFAGAVPHVITQEDLTEERWLTIEAGRVLRSLEHKRELIRQHLRDGWPVEDGLRSAQLILSPESDYRVHRKSSEKLIVR